MSWIGLREGRLRERFHESASEYIYSRRMEEQRALFDTHIWIHKAHVAMLAEEGSIPLEQAGTILRALREISADDVELDPRLGDLYTNTERHLIRMVGDVAGAMHTGRSRNDLSATSTRMSVREGILDTVGAIHRLQKILVEKAEGHRRTVMPGYTHLQQAQPITFAHWLMAYNDLLSEDLERLRDALTRTNRCTLGAAALAGTGHRINRRRTAELLGFDGLVENSLHCVNGRGYLLEALFALTLLMNHLDRLHQDVYLWTTQEFSTVELDDAYAGTSSIMPQKKNPLLQETLRARYSTQVGRLTSSLVTMKDLPMGHNFDVYELNLLFSESARELLESLDITGRVIETLTINEERMRENLELGYITATELADVIVREAGIPFRAAHQITGNLVRRAIESGLKLQEVPPEMLQGAARETVGRELDLSMEDLRLATDPTVNVERRSSLGGPAPKEVKRMIDERREEIEAGEAWRDEFLRGFDDARDMLEDRIDEFLG
ncbi:MAG: argininosuccinate lyase [Candidatus Bathyarchaeia archaeon]